MTKRKKITEQHQRLLTLFEENGLNKSYFARLLYPDVPKKYAENKFHAKLWQHNYRYFDQNELDRLDIIIDNWLDKLKMIKDGNFVPLSEEYIDVLLKNA
jgi:hypothetical protein